jgi:hypothetical protein
MLYRGGTFSSCLLQNLSVLADGNGITWNVSPHFSVSQRKVIPFCNTSTGQLFTTTAASFHTVSENNWFTDATILSPTVLDISLWVSISQFMTNRIAEVLSTAYRANNLTDIEIHVMLEFPYEMPEGTLSV